MIRDIEKLKEDRIIEARLAGFDFIFHTTWGLFSPEHIDEGTAMLIKELDLAPADTSLDLGCGYGPIGLAAAKISPMGKVHMVDKDFVAAEYSKKNAELNRIENAQVYLSNAFGQVPDIKFDNIISNIPAKVNKEFFWIMINDAKDHLKPGGKIYIVTLSGLKDFIKRNLNDFFGNYKKLAQGKTYAAYMAIKS